MNDRSIIRMGGIASALAIAMAVSSCHYKELCMDHNHGSNVAVRFDWNKCTRTPQNMEMKLECVRLDDSNALRYSLDGENGGNIRLENGSWKALAWNDNESIILDYGMARSADGREIVATSRTSTLAESTQISTKTEMPLTAGNASERVALQPEPIWSGSSEIFECPADSITLIMRKRTYTVHIIVNDVRNIQYSGEFGAALSGLSGGLRLSDGSTLEEKVTMGAPLTKTATDRLEGHLECFGYMPETPSGHILTIYAVLRDGSKWYSSTDVTDQMHSNETASAGSQEDLDTTDDITVIIDGLPLPKPITNGSGFKPEIDSWQEVSIEIGM